METSNSTSGSASGSGTPIPMVSNPGTPRSMVEAEVRQTPPPSSSSATSTPVAPVSLSRTASPAHVASPAAHLPQPIQIPQSQLQQAMPKQHHQLPQSKYAQLLAVIEDMGKDIRPTYSGSKTSSERLKRGIVHARILVRECLMECERSARS